MEYDKIVRTTAWSPGPGCHGGCGVKLYVKDGKVVKAEGDESHPFSHGRACSRLLALTQYMYHKDRIIHPLKRVGVEVNYLPFPTELCNLCTKRTTKGELPLLC